MDQTLPFTRLGKYRINSVLGRGGMGTVYRGHDTTIDRPVAIKVLHQRLTDGEQGRDLEARFLREAQAVARCLHPNIIALFDYGKHEETPYIVMEYVEGADLRGLLDSGHVLEHQDAFAIIGQVLAALEHAHGKGVVHRDIKPANIMLLDGLVVKVADFGVARLDTSDLTHAGDMVGTPSYMSPEGLRGEAVDGRSDLYSTGMVLLELLCRRRPYPGQVGNRDVAELLAEAGVEQSRVAPLAQLLRPALQVEPARRYQSAGAFSAELHKLRPAAASAYSDATWVLPRTGTAIAHAPSHAAVSGAWQPELLQVVEQGLARFVGPMARLLVRKEADRSQSVDQLADSLARHIPSEEERREFLRVIENSGARAHVRTPTPGPQSAGAASNAAPAPASFAPEQLAAAVHALAFHMGPMAQRMVALTARRAVSLADLYERLAAQIPSDAERDQFLRKRPH